MELLRLAGGWFLVAGALARLPAAMIPIGTMLLVTHTTGSVATAGLATACVSLGTATCAPLQGKLADRNGQVGVLLAAAITNSLALALLTFAAVNGAATPLLLVLCALVGATTPQISAMARSRWIGLAAGRPNALAASTSWESVVDELTFVFGPALVGLLATTVPSSPLLVAAALFGVFGIAFAVHPSAAAASPLQARRGASAPLVVVLRRIIAPVLGMFALGGFFGSSQAAVTGVAVTLGEPARAGLLYAVMGIGSAVTALALVAVPPRVTARMRWGIGGLGMVAAMLVATQLSSAESTAVLLFIAGLFIGPAIVTLFAVCGEKAPAGSIGTAMTMLISANVVGVALGAAVGGVTVEALAGTTFAGWTARLP